MTDCRTTKAFSWCPPPVNVRPNTAPPERRVRYPRSILMPANPGDSVEHNWLVCNFCDRMVTVVIERTRDGDTRSNVPICCDHVARMHHDIERCIDG